jgi:hypothetical protein
MIVLGIDPGPETHGAVVYDTQERCAVWAEGRITRAALRDVLANDLDRITAVVIERPAAMGPMGAGKVGHMLDTAWAAGELAAMCRGLGYPVRTMTRREVLRGLGVLSGSGSSDARVRAACIADHGASKSAAVGRKANPGPLYGVSSHAWQALGLVLAWLEVRE